MKVYISSDHGGYELKNYITEQLTSKGWDVQDLGPAALNPEDDFPDYVEPVVENVLKTPEARGILICRNGVGVSIAANKHKNIRAGLSWTKEHAASSRRDDNTNVLALPADYLDKGTALETAETWLQTEFSQQPRFLRRLAKLDNLG